jgi:pyruvate/2-oxoglutarate/acetoin dehydrogenase E1 component
MQGTMLVLESLNAALHRAFVKDERVILLGEDILDPYGGAFKVTRGLSTAFPGRLLTTPISEAGIIGVATGMAMRGLRPVVEIMFGDFITLAADQLINHAAKFRLMYGREISIPLVIRTPMGGRRGYGPTHSQTLEKHFLGVPGLRVLAPNMVEDPGALLEHAILDGDEPTLFVENKLLYLLETGAGEEFSAARTGSGSHATTLTLRGAPPANITIAAYGYMVELARQAAVRLAYEFEVFAEIVALTQLAPIEASSLLDSVRRTGRLVTVEEGSLSMGWGAEIAARAAETCAGRLRSVRRVAAKDLPVPASVIMEKAVLPGVNEIVKAVLESVSEYG